MLINNNTQIPIEVGILDQELRNIIRIYKIAPGDSQPAPVELAYTSRFVVQPDRESTSGRAVAAIYG